MDLRYQPVGMTTGMVFAFTRPVLYPQWHAMSFRWHISVG